MLSQGQWAAGDPGTLHTAQATGLTDHYLTN